MKGRAGRFTTPPPVGDQSRLPRLYVCTVTGSRSKATAPAAWLRDRNVEQFFRDLLRLKPNQEIQIREVYE